MAKGMLLEDILNGVERKEKRWEKGVCQRCGHYCALEMSSVGIKLCCDCQSRLEQDGKKSF